MRRVLQFALACTIGAAAACSDDPSGPEGAERSGTYEAGSAPPEVLVDGDRGVVTLQPVLCQGRCVGPETGPAIGAPSEVRFRSKFTDWAPHADLQLVDGSECPRRLTAPVERQADGSWIVRPAGKAGTYDVILRGTTPDGSLSAAFRWTTPSDGVLPTPQARLGVLAGVPWEPQSYGVELHLTGLRSSPADAKAEIRVLATAGGSVTFQAVRAPGCWSEGDLYWDGPDEQGAAAAALGPGLFTYEVEVTLDGQIYRATAEWPTDTIVDNPPSVRLEFSPPLPALT